MTVGNSFCCPDCGAVLHLKFQVDDSLNWRVWPVVLECPKCKSIIEAEFSQDENGLTASRNIDGRRGPNLKKAEVRSDGGVIGYCDLLPTPEPLYYKQYKMGLCMSSIFMHFDSDLMMKYRPISHAISDGIVRYRHMMPALYALLCGDQTNVEAFKSRLARELELKPEECTLSNADDCYEMYEQLHGAIRKALRPYDENPIYDYFDKIWTWIVKAGPEVFVDVRKVCSLTEDACRRLYDDCNRRINATVEELQKLMPAMLLDYMCRDDGDGLYLMTARHTEINSLYEANYAVVMKMLPALMAIDNCRRTGDCNSFTDNEGKKSKFGMSDFISQQDGTRAKLVLQLDHLSPVLKDVINNHIRNGVDHQETDYDPKTQEVIYHYQNSRGDAIEKHRLIKVAHMCLQQLRVLCQLLRISRLLYYA